MEDRVDQIMHIAAELFNHKGYAATSLRDIAKAVGVQPASIYHYFDSKQSLLFAVLSKTMDDLIEGAQSGLIEYTEPADQLRAIIRNHVMYHGLCPTEATVGDIELRGLDGENLAFIVGKRDVYQRILEQVVEFGEHIGVFDVVDRKLTVYALIAMSTEVGLWYRPAGKLSLEEIADLYAEMSLRLVGGNPEQLISLERQSTKAHLNKA